jgi:hypothetical protein
MHDNLLMPLSVKLCLLYFQKFIIVSFKLFQERMVPVKNVCVYVFIGVLDILERWRVERKAVISSLKRPTYFHSVLQNVCQTSADWLFFGVFSVNIVFFPHGPKS